MKRPDENIHLDYPVIIQDWPKTDSVYFCPDGCEFFQDEHGNQWVKFYPKNGYKAWQLHMVRTETVIVVRDDQSN